MKKHTAKLERQPAVKIEPENAVARAVRPPHMVISRAGIDSADRFDFACEVIG